MNAVGVRNLLIGLAVLIVAVGAGLVGFRKPLLEEGVKWWLTELGIPFGALSVAQLDHRSVVFRDVSVGPGNVMSAGAVQLTFALPDLVSGQVRAIRLTDLRIDVDLSRDPTQLEKTTALYRSVAGQLASGTRDGAPTPPPVYIDNGRIAIAGATGSADIAFAASLLTDDANRLTVAADLIAGRIETSDVMVEEIRGPATAVVAEDRQIMIRSDLSMAAAGKTVGPHGLSARMEARIDAGSDTLDLSVLLSSGDAGIDMRADTRLSEILTRPEGSLELSGRIDTAGAAWTALSGQTDASGAVEVDFEGALSFGHPKENAPSSAKPSGFLISGNGAVRTDALVIPSIGRARTESLAFETTATDISVDLKILTGSVVTVVPDDYIRARLPETVADLIVGEFSVDLSQSRVAAVRLTPGEEMERWRMEAKPRVTLRAQDGERLTLDSSAVLEGIGVQQISSVEGEADLVLDGLSVSQPALQAGDVKAEFAIGFRADDASLDLRMLRPGTLSVGAISTESVRTQAPVKLELADGILKAGALNSPAPGFSAALTLQPDETVRTVIGQSGAAVHIVEALLGPVRLTASGAVGACSNGTVESDKARLASAGEAVELRNTQVTVSHGCPGGGFLASATVGAARHLGDHPLLAPVSLRAHVTDTEDGYAFDGAVDLTEGTELFVVSGDVAADGTSGEFTAARTAPLVFAADGPAPADFSATLDPLKRVRGQVDGTARYRWSPGGVSSEARLDLTDLSFDVGAVAVRDLDLGLSIRPIWPPVTPEAQFLSIAQIEAGAALEDAAIEEIKVSYDLLATEPTQLRINGLDGRFLGGTLRFAPFSVDPARARTETVLQVAGLDMAALATLTNLKSLEATGRLGGSIPIVLDEGKLAIRGGRLDAAGPGRLSFTSSRAAELLRGQGAEVEMMLLALQDFRYDSLGMDLDKTAEDDLTLKLSLLGNNPDVLDGHPFRVNLNLTSRITPVLDALAVLYRMSRETLERVWTTR